MWQHISLIALIKHYFVLLVRTSTLVIQSLLMAFNAFIKPIDSPVIHLYVSYALYACYCWFKDAKNLLFVVMNNNAIDRT